MRVSLDFDIEKVGDMTDQVNSGKSTAARIGRKCLFILGTMFLMIGISGISGYASAGDQWGTWVQSGTGASGAMEMDYDDSVQPSKQSDANQEIALSACVDGITATDDSYNIRIVASAVADVLPGTGYTIDKYEYDGMPSFVEEYPNIALGDNQGQVMMLPNDVNGYQWYFNYYGKYYDRFFVSDNGFVAWGFPNIPVGELTTAEMAGLSGKDFQFAPDSRVPNGVVAPYWHDFKPDSETGTPSKIRWGTVNLRGTEDGIMVMWENFNSNKNYNDIFSVAFVCFTSSVHNPYAHTADAQDQYIYFYYKQINLDFQVKSGRYKQLFGISIENQFGTKGILVDYGNPTSPLLCNGIKIRFNPNPQNQYKIKDIYLIGTTSYGYSGSSSPDPWGDVQFDGQHNGVYGGSNIITAANQPTDPYNFFTDPGTQVAVAGALAVLACIPVVNAAVLPVAVGLACTGFLYDFGGICYGMKDTSPYFTDGLPPGGVIRDNDYYNNWFITRNKALDGVVGGVTSECTFDAMIAPVINWKIYRDSPVLPGVDNFLRYDHHIYMYAFAHVNDQNGNAVPQIGTSVELRVGPDMLVSYSGNSATFPNAFDTFNDGKLSDLNNPWDSSGKAGTGVIELAKRPGMYPSVLYEDFIDSQVSDWTFPLPYYRGGYCGLDTTQGATTSVGEVKSSLKVSKASSTGESWATRYFKKTSAWDHITAEAKVMFSDTCRDDWCRMQLRQGDTARVNLIFKSGTIHAYVDSTGASQYLTSFSANTWYTIYLDINVIEKKYNVYVNGVLVTSSPVPFSGPLSGDAYVSNVFFQAGYLGGGTAKTIWADNIQVARDMSLHVKYSGSTNTARAKSPMYTVYTTTQYSVAFDFYIPSASKSNMVVLFDDLQVELRWKSNKQVYAVVGPNNAEISIGIANMDTWNRITIDVRPGTGYYVGLNYIGYGAHEDHGPYALKTGYSGSSYYMYFGAKVSPAKQDVGDAYWDNVLLGIYSSG